MQRPRDVLAEGPVTLRRWRAGPRNAAALHTAVAQSRTHLWPWMPWATADYGLTDAGEFLQVCERQWESGEAFNYAIMNGEVLAGSCGLMDRIGAGGLEIGYWVHAAQIRRGLATAAAAALAAEAFTLPGIGRVEIVHDAENVASGAVPRKLGFTQIERRPGPSEEQQAAGRETIDVVWRLTGERRAPGG